MAQRRPQDTILVAALGLLGLQVVLFAALRAQPDPPAELPDQDLPQRSAERTDDPAPPDLDKSSVEVLDHLLAERVRAAAARRGVDPAPLLPSEAVRAAALAAPSPVGPAVDALIQAYKRSLASLGETLDATSSPATAAAP